MKDSRKKKKMRIIVADDHAIVREGLIQILLNSKSIEAVDEASDGQSLIAKIRKNSYDMIILDISMPGQSGLDILKQARSIKPGVPVLVLSMHPEDQYALRSIRAGASGYLTKESASGNLIEAIERIYGGGRYISQKLAEQIAESLQYNYEGDPHENLSDREYQVMCAIASGKSVSEIASEMFLSVKTISTYRRRILEKMRMRNNAELTHYCISNSLV